MKRTVLTAAIAALVAAPAIADPGKDQFAGVLGVDGDLYTMSELIRLENRPRRQ